MQRSQVDEVEMASNKAILARNRRFQIAGSEGRTLAEMALRSVPTI
jgi:hypothetical protein